VNNETPVCRTGARDAIVQCINDFVQQNAPGKTGEQEE
jgi:hypothetical protein